MATAERLAAAFWPGPLTLVLPKRAGLPGQRPCHLPGSTASPCACRRTGPRRRCLRHSAARWWRLPPTAPDMSRRPSAAHVLADLRGRIDLIVDGGPCAVGLESTIVGLPRRAGCCCGPAACRARTSSARSDTLVLLPPADEAPLAPGMLASHYAPRARLRLDASAVRRRRSAACIRTAAARRAPRTLNLSPRGNLIEAAANLFSHLRALDLAGATDIAVMPIPHDGLGEAINDRLARAAAPKV